MKKWIAIASCSLGLNNAEASLNSLGAILAVDTKDVEGVTYRNYRTAQDPFMEKKLKTLQEEGVLVFDERVLQQDIPWARLTEEQKQGVLISDVPSTEGLRKLRMSGVSQFGGAGFQDIVRRIRDSGHTGGITVVDFREEPHAFVNAGVPLSIYARGDAFNRGKNWAEVEKTETELIDMVDASDEVWLHHITGKHGDHITHTSVSQVPVEVAFNEKYLVKDLNGCGYARIAVTDHRRAMDDDLDDFKKLQDSLPNDTWVLYHCRGGRGRTTSGMVFHDILANADKEDLCFTDIILRQWLIGGSNLMMIPETGDKEWKAKAAYDRIKTIYRLWADTRRHGNHYRWFYEQDEGSFKDSRHRSQGSLIRMNKKRQAVKKKHSN